MLALPLPAVMITDLRLNEQRYVTLLNIMKAKKKPLAILTPAEVDVAPRLKALKVAEPLGRSAGIVLDSVEEFVARLRGEAKVII